jgi:hypothetical protein
MWELHKARNSAIEALSEDVDGLGALDKVIFATEYKVCKWLLAGLEALVTQCEAVSREDTERMGWEMAARVLRVRDEIRTSSSRNCGSCKKRTYMTEIMPTFCGQCSDEFDWTVKGEAARGKVELTSILRTEFQRQMQDAEI